jgi:hypothetical protein
MVPLPPMVPPAFTVKLELAIWPAPGLDDTCLG